MRSPERMWRLFVHEAKNVPGSWNPLRKASWFSPTTLAKGPSLQFTCVTNMDKSPFGAVLLSSHRCGMGSNSAIQLWQVRLSFYTTSRELLWTSLLEIIQVRMRRWIFFISSTRFFYAFSSQQRIVLFGEGEEGHPILLVSLDDREPSASKVLLPSPVSLPTQKPGHWSWSTCHLQVGWW